MRKQKASARLKAALKPVNVVRRLEVRRVIQDFAEGHGLVYFGTVDHRSDDHRLVRGMTTSAHQEDKDYCIGSYADYDVVFVRRKVTYLGDKQTSTWLIMQIDLKQSMATPHILIAPPPGHHKQYDKITRALPTLLTPIIPGVFGPLDASFSGHYSIYTKPSRSVDAERIISGDVAAAIGQHFPPLVVEIWDGCLFIYSTTNRPSDQLLDVMLRNGAWLAEQIDARLASLQAEAQPKPDQN